MSPHDPLRLLTLTVALLFAPTSFAQDTRAPAETARSAHAKLDDAWAALDALELERASAILEPLVASPTLDPAARARAWLALGLTRASLLDEGGARAAFAAALAIDGALTLPDNASPKVRAIFEETRSSLLPEGVPTPTPPPSAPIEQSAEQSGDTERALTREAPSQSARAPESQAPASVGEAESEPWPLYVASSALAAGSVIAGAGAVAAELDLARAPTGRTRSEYDTTLTLGVAAFAISMTLGAGALTALGAALLQSPKSDG